MESAEFVLFSLSVHALRPIQQQPPPPGVEKRREEMVVEEEEEEEEEGRHCDCKPMSGGFEADQFKEDIVWTRRPIFNFIENFVLFYPNIIVVSCPICNILQVLFHTTFILFVCPESCCSLLFHLLTHPFGKNIFRELSVFSSSLLEFLWFLLLV